MSLVNRAHSCTKLNDRCHLVIIGNCHLTSVPLLLLRRATDPLLWLDALEIVGKVREGEDYDAQVVH